MGCSVEGGFGWHDTVTPQRLRNKFACPSAQNGYGSEASKRWIREDFGFGWETPTLVDVNYITFGEGEDVLVLGSVG